jgi:hypothetical protein
MRRRGLIPSIWREQPGNLFCVSTKTEHGSWRDEWFASTELVDAARYALRRRELCDVYFCPNGFISPKRHDKSVLWGVYAYADLDEADPRSCKPRPTIAIESSPGRYVGLWHVDTTISATLNKRMTYAVGADRGGWDSTQLLRFPGTYNFKYPACPRVNVMWDNGPKYRVHDLERIFPKLRR